jgi:hypothetical protein
MPKNCRECPFVFNCKNKVDIDKRPKNCQLVSDKKGVYLKSNWWIGGMMNKTDIGWILLIITIIILAMLIY